MRAFLRSLLLLAAVGCAAHASAQAPTRPNGVFLVAKPGLSDPNFRQTVVLVTQTDEASSVGVIINRPSPLKLSQFLHDESAASKYRDAVFLGGPVMPQALLAVFHSDTPPDTPAFHILRGLYLTPHPEGIRRLLNAAGSRYRLYAGFSGWSPEQLGGELGQSAWFVLPADESAVFREDMSGLWRELVERASAQRTGNPTGGAAAENRSPATGGAGVPGWRRAALQE